MLFDALFAQAQTQSQQTAIVDDAMSSTYGQLASAAEALAAYLREQTHQPRVGLLLPTSSAFAIGFYGILLAGKTAVPINFLLGDKEIAHIVKDSGVDALVTMPRLATRVKDTSLRIIDVNALSRPSSPILQDRPDGAAGDVALVMYTSGTSGLPKGVELTHHNVQSSVDAAIQHAQLGGTHRFLGILPLFHSTGLLATLVAPIQLGSTVFFQARFSPLAVVKAIKEHQISIMAAVPSMYGAMLRLRGVGPEDVQSLFAPISGGEPLPSRIREGWQQKFGIPLCEGYGLTETVGPIAFNIPGHMRSGSVGQLVPGASARIVDEQGKALPCGEVGEVFLSGPMIMKGYLHLAEDTSRAFRSRGFFASGDVGKLDADGYLYITGRKEGLINMAGEKVNPREIEEILMTHPAIAEAAVVGRSDESRGQSVAAFVVAKDQLSPRPAELRDFCRVQGLPQWKIPREIQIVSDLPRSTGGKVLKRELLALSGSKP